VKLVDPDLEVYATYCPSCGAQTYKGPVRPRTAPRCEACYPVRNDLRKQLRKLKREKRW